MKQNPAARRRQLLGPVPVVTADDDPAFATESPPTNVAGISGTVLRGFIERIERLKKEIREMQADVKEVKTEAKAAGFDVKVINYLIRIREQDADDIAEFMEVVETYKRAIGDG